MARIGAGGERRTDDTTDDGGGRPAPDERMDRIGTAPDDGPEPEPEPEPTPEPAQPARGRQPAPSVPDPDPTPDPDPVPDLDLPARGNDPDSGSGRGSGGADTPDPEPQPEPNQPARGNDRTSGGGRGSGGSDATDDPTDTPDDFYMPGSPGPQTGPGGDPDAQEELQDKAAMTPERQETLSDATDDGGLLNEKQERDLQRATANIYETLDVSQGVDEFLQGAGVPGPAAGFAAGVSKFPASIASAVPGAVYLGEQGIETGQAVATGETEAIDTGQAVASASAELIGDTIGEFRDDPAEATGALAAELLASAGAIKALEKTSDVARGARIRSQADDTVKLEDITTPEGAKGDLPNFETPPDAPTAKAVREVQERAADNPSAITPGESESALFHTTRESLPGDVDVAEGSSELPGLFTSPDASPLRLNIPGEGSLSDIKPRLPKLRSSSDEVVTLPGDDIRAMADDATGSGRVPDADDGWKPDPDTSGYEFLSEQAEEGAAYVRPTGGRTTELEAIYPPGSQFVEEGTTAVRIGTRQVPGTDIDIPGTGRTVPGRRFTRADGPDGPDTPDLEKVADDVPDPDTDTTDITSLPESSVTRRSGTPIGPPVGGSPGPTPTPSGTQTTPSGSAPTSVSKPSDIGGSGSSPGPSEPTDTPTFPPSSPGGGSSGGAGTSGGGGSPTDTGPTPPPSSPTGSPTGSSPTPTGGSPGPSSGGGGSGFPFDPTPAGSGTSPTRLSESKKKKEEELFQDLEAFEEDFETGIADVEDLLGGGDL